MTHGEKLKRLKENMDDLKVRRPDIYEDEEKHIDKDVIRTGNEVAAGRTDLPPGIQRLEKRK
jgi:hypothetical protein